MKNDFQIIAHKKGFLLPLIQGVSRVALISGLLNISTSYAVDTAPSLRADAPNVYIVKQGDTLWDISSRFLKSPWRWTEIWAENRQIKNPHWIYPNNRLLLCHIQDKNVVGVDTGDGCEGVVKSMVSPTAKNPAAALPEYRLQPSVRAELLDAAIASIPLSHIKHWLLDGLVLSPPAYSKAPYVLAIKDNRVIATTGDTLYVRGEPLPLGASYGIYRENGQFTDPETKAKLGLDVRLVARAKVMENNPKISTIVVTESVTSEVREGDRVIVEPVVTLPTTFYPVTDTQVPPGRVISVMESVGNASKDSAIVINRGSDLGAKPGQVMAVYHRGALHDSLKGDTVRLPSEREGLVMIYSVFEHLSYGIILESSTVIKVGDETRAVYGD